MILGSSDRLDTANATTLGSGLGADRYGVAISTAGDVDGDGYSDVIIGAPDDEAGATNQGAVFLYVAGLVFPDTTADWDDDVGAATVLLGTSVSTAGDMNADGYSDIVVGGPRYDSDADSPREGAAFVYLGSADGPPSSPDHTITVDEDNAQVGNSVACAGDLNGDGFSDLLVGAPRKNGRGIVYVYEGASTLSFSTPADSLEPSVASAEFGFSVAGAGDVNADGYSDIVVGSYRWGAGAEPDEGRAFIYLGSASGINTTPSDTLQPPGSYAGAQEFGYSVSSAGDVNADGFGDIIVGSPRFDFSNTDGVGRQDSGAAFIYLGNSSGVDEEYFKIIRGVHEAQLLGVAVAGVGDVNADGFAGVAIGSPKFENLDAQEGRAEIWNGARTPGSMGRVWAIESDIQQAELGNDVSPAGDINGDGLADFIVTTHRIDLDASVQEAGRVEVFLGTESGFPSTSPAWSKIPNQDGAAFGTNSELAGDVNGDGYADLIVGAVGWEQNTIGGKALVYYGNADGGLDRTLAQTQKNGDPLFSEGMTSDTDEFNLEALGRTPAGRDSVRIQWEIRKKAILFTGSVSNESGLYDTGSPTGTGSSVTINETIAIQTNNTHRWRMRLATPNPYFPQTPWFTLPYNGPLQYDLRAGATSVGVASGSLPKISVSLSGAQPNPFNPTTRIGYSVSDRTWLRLGVYDLSGRLVRILADRQVDGGDYTLLWDGLNNQGKLVASGVYFIHLDTGRQSRSTKAVLIR